MSRPQGETRTLLVKLDPEALAEKAVELAGLIREEDDYRTAFEDWLDGVKATKKVKQSTLEGLHRSVSKLAEVVDLGSEEREVGCSYLYALGEGYAFLVRDDTGEMIQHRKLEEAERQTDLTEVLREPTPEQLSEWLGRIQTADLLDIEASEVEGHPVDDLDAEDLEPALAGDLDREAVA